MRIVFSSAGMTRLAPLPRTMTTLLVSIFLLMITSVYGCSQGNYAYAQRSGDWRRVKLMGWKVSVQSWVVQWIEEPVLCKDAKVEAAIEDSICGSYCTANCYRSPTSIRQAKGDEMLQTYCSGNAGGPVSGAAADDEETDGTLIIGIICGIAGLVFAVCLYGGYKWCMSTGNEDDPMVKQNEKPKFQWGRSMTFGPKGDQKTAPEARISVTDDVGMPRASPRGSQTTAPRSSQGPGSQPLRSPRMSQGPDSQPLRSPRGGASTEGSPLRSPRGRQSMLTVERAISAPDGIEGGAGSQPMRSPRERASTGAGGQPLRSPRGGRQSILSTESAAMGSRPMRSPRGSGTGQPMRSPRDRAQNISKSPRLSQ